MNPANHQPTPTATNAQTSSDELRALLNGLEGKGPREVLGAVAQGHLGWAIVQAVVGCAALMAVLTVVPYLLSKNASGGDSKVAVQTPEPTEQPEPTKVEPKSSEPAKTTDPSGKPPVAVSPPAKPPEKPSDDLLNKLKENETKTGAPKDPFGTNIDDLLKDK